MQEIERDIVPVPVEENRRAWLDFALAGCICAIALGFWFWNNLPSLPAAYQPAPAARAMAPGAPQSNLSQQLNNAGTQLYATANYAGAESLFRRAIDADPNMALGYSNLGAALTSERRYDEAIVALQKALALDPSFTMARNNLKWALDEKQKQKK